MTLSAEARQRYARHLVLPQVGEAGQERLARASVLIVGLGGLGSPAALYLAAAGVGRIGLMDFDTVAVHNLQRQVLYGTTDIGEAKTSAARGRLEGLNPLVAIDTWAMALTRENARGIVAGYDVVIDATDSFGTRYLLNDACVLEGKPCVQGSVHRFEGRLSVYGTAEGPCYRCVHPTPPAPGSVDDCATGGVLGVLPGIVGAMQATEAIKLILGIGEPLVGRLLLIDALTMQMHEVQVARDPACEWCGKRTRKELESIDEICEPMIPSNITPADLSVRLARGEALYLLDVREPWEVDVAVIEGSNTIPMSNVPARMAEIPRDREVVVICHHGMRSAMVADYLRSAGVPQVLNLTGGIDRWSVEVDPSVARY
ncbi:MAG: molybdopterin-synthase adenylyltransferase MoeB [Gemmatimonadota bacterium]|nr:molybdopterin-synthase adenylyltransferase MoeB [Gemmatimonadota bacterium]MDQ8178550.1 molybdopterin-synthase adenylyltransferase MoeB [Gemmatimonadota bacterium]